nr:MAG TPA: hypothetical protein [Caudoviricetes sp.]
MCYNIIKDKEIRKQSVKENKIMKKEFIKNNNLTVMVREHVIEEQRR